MPPARIDAPSTSKRLPMIDPVRDALTTPVSPLLNATRRDDQFRGIAKGRIEKTADARTGARSQLFGRATHPAGQRHDRDRGDNKEQRCSFRHAGTYRSAIATGTASRRKSSGVRRPTVIFARAACLIGAWPRRRSSNFIRFPPEGRASHVRLVASITRSPRHRTN